MAVDVGQPHVAAAEAVRQAFVVDAQTGAASWRAGRGSRPCSRRRNSRSRRSPRRWCPPLTPPPAIQMVKPNGLWSRPSEPWAIGRAAELAGPDDQRLVEQAASLADRAAARRSADRRPGRCSRGPPSGCCAGPSDRRRRPGTVSSTNRTPRSTSRRAIRHWWPNRSGRLVVAVEAVQRAAWRASRRSVQ